jgi:hypothetical protein
MADSCFDYDEEEKSRTSAASFIQTAARNVLDDASQDDDVDSVAPGQRKRDPLSPSLRSLQTKRVPPIPDEQDRKRFVGCLAAVLAATCDFEELNSTDSDEELARAEHMAYLDDEEDDDDDEETETSQRAIYSATSDSWEFPDTSRSDRKSRSTPDFATVQQQQYPHGLSISKIESRKRYRKRRYDVLSRLLLSSAELLQLEKGQVKAFLPVLAKLLVPNRNHHHHHHHHNNNKNQRESLRTRSTRDSAGSPPANKLQYSAAVHSFGADDSFVDHQLDRIEHLRPFLESLTPGSGFRCLTMFLLNHLLTSQDGYDARVRHALKTLGVILLIQDMQDNNIHILSYSTDDPRRGKSSCSHLLEMASRKFEALEVAVASKLLQLSREQERIAGNSSENNARKSGRRARTHIPSRQNSGPTREDVLRGLKVGGTALVAGTLFAVTGGLAAPGIAAGVGMLLGGTAVTAAAAAALTSTAAMTAIFGVGGGGLAAYKMHRRTEGLTEFEFRKETNRQTMNQGFSHREHSPMDADLFSTIAISGWLRDEFDFQRPWGVTPSNPRLRDRVELLERFYSVYRPDHVPKCRKILQSWEGEEKELWQLLKEKYGRDPDHLFPLDDGPRLQAGLTLDEEEVIEELLVELGFVERQFNVTESPVHATPFERMRHQWRPRPRPPAHPAVAASATSTSSEQDSLHGPISSNSRLTTESQELPLVASSGLDSLTNVVFGDDKKDASARPSHLATVWSYTETYGGELYTVRWESELMMELCDSVNDLALDLVTGSTAQVLRHTALASLMSAIAWPYALVSAANMIDGTWTLAVERADLAGKELARSLLFSRAGRRPVTLVGYSFGSRVVYACLKELATYQDKWEVFQETGRLPDNEVEGESVERLFRQMREPASIVEDAVLLGLPNHLSLSSWKACRQVVAGRLINCFSNKDLILSLMFQFKRLGLKPVCGTCPVNVNGVENVDISDLVQGHQDYCDVAGAILRRVRLSQPFSSRPTKLFIPIQ